MKKSVHGSRPPAVDSKIKKQTNRGSARLKENPVTDSQSQTPQVRGKTQKVPTFSIYAPSTWEAEPGTSGSTRKRSPLLPISKPSKQHGNVPLANKEDESFRRSLVNVLFDSDTGRSTAESTDPCGSPISDVKRYDYYIRHGVDLEQVAPMEDSRVRNILVLVPPHLQHDSHAVEDFLDEVKEDYLFSMKKAMVDFVLPGPSGQEEEKVKEPAPLGAAPQGAEYTDEDLLDREGCAELQRGRNMAPPFSLCVHSTWLPESGTPGDRRPPSPIDPLASPKQGRGVRFPLPNKERERFRKALVKIIFQQDCDTGRTTATEKDISRYYDYIKNGIDTEEVTPMADMWVQKIVDQVPAHLKCDADSMEVLLEEIREDYLFSMKKAMVDFVLEKPMGHDEDKAKETAPDGAE